MQQWFQLESRYWKFTPVGCVVAATRLTGNDLDEAEFVHAALHIIGDQRLRRMTIFELAELANMYFTAGTLE